MLWSIDLPWTPAECSPNARGHWAKKATAAKKYRQGCKVLTGSAMFSAGITPADVQQAAEQHGHLDLWIEYFPPDRRHRDDDNLVASFKSGRDGIADAIGVDDTHFRIHPWLHRDQPKKGGLVLVTVTAGQSAAIEMVMPAATDRDVCGG